MSQESCSTLELQNEIDDCLSSSSKLLEYSRNAETLILPSNQCIPGMWSTEQFVIITEHSNYYEQMTLVIKQIKESGPDAPKPSLPKRPKSKLDSLFTQAKQRKTFNPQELHDYLRSKCVDHCGIDKQFVVEDVWNIQGILSTEQLLNILRRAARQVKRCEALMLLLYIKFGAFLVRVKAWHEDKYDKMKSKNHGILSSETTIDDIEEPAATEYINLLKDKIVIEKFPLKIKIIITSEFATPIAFDRIESHYSHPAKVVLTQNNLSKFYDDLIDKFKAWVDQFQERGSGFDFNSIKSVQYEEDEFQEATECYICGKEFEENNKVREHDHLSGKYRGAACQSCNTKEDANNLYGWSMSKKLPTKDFKWEEDPDYYKKVPKGRGCLIKCDLKYTDKCKKKTIKYPLAPEKTRPKKELSNYQLNLLGNKPLEEDGLCKDEKKTKLQLLAMIEENIASSPSEQREQFEIENKS
ncbi:unnamed protein product [Mytilus coruscus]|uniref:C2H2-type domain-containing protein n=1 Tax=Mytilus coruscus TaxID=42192 RepID=A0A6J8ELU2_MYTCO|nr:unnamed protein product [Mytilus coruscus]